MACNALRGMVRVNRSGIGTGPRGSGRDLGHECPERVCQDSKPGDSAFVVSACRGPGYYSAHDQDWVCRRWSAWQGHRRDARPESGVEAADVRHHDRRQRRLASRHPIDRRCLGVHDAAKCSRALERQVHDRRGCGRGRGSGGAAGVGRDRRAAAGGDLVLFTQPWPVCGRIGRWFHAAGRCGGESGILPQRRDDPGWHADRPQRAIAPVGRPALVAIGDLHRVGRCRAVDAAGRRASADPAQCRPDHQPRAASWPTAWYRATQRIGRRHAAGSRATADGAPAHQHAKRYRYHAAWPGGRGGQSRLVARRIVAFVLGAPPTSVHRHCPAAHG